MTGKVTFVGAGPGDPRLVTTWGAEALARAAVVVHGPDVHPDLLALHGRADATRVSVQRESSDAIAARLVEAARQGAEVARVVTGDPTMLSVTIDEVARVRAAGVEVEVVPGVSGAMALGACAGIAAERSLTILRLGAREKFVAAPPGTELLVVSCDGERVAQVAGALVASGHSAQMAAAVVVDVGRPTQLVEVGQLGGWATGRLAAEAVLFVVGDAVARREALAWMEKRPLFGKRVLVTRAADQARGTAALLRARGAEPLLAPTIELGPPDDPAPLERAIAALPSAYDFVAFTSANGVEHAWREIARRGRDARALGGVQIAAIGPGTAAALEAHGLRADVVAKEFKGEGLAAEMLRAFRGKPARVLLARAQKARDVLPDALRAAGCTVDVVAAYATRPPSADRAAAIRAKLAAGEIDAVTFTSSSTADNLCDLLGDDAPALLARTRVASIGPITSATARARGLRVDVEATAFTLIGLVDALEASWSRTAGA